MTKIAIVGEAWGAEEAKERRPFIGITGQHLTFMLQEAGINRSECFITNVFNLRPASNKIESLTTGDNPDALPNYPPILKGKRIHKKYAPELQRLQDELLTIDPNIIILLGNVALWALQGKTTISRHRGCIEASTHTVTGFKTIATYHPASILPRRSPENRPIIVADLIKAERESHFQEIRRPECEIWINPTLEDLYEFEKRYIAPTSLLSVDIETSGSCITTVGFGIGGRVALVIPFVDTRRKGHCYWSSLENEIQAWRFVQRIMSDRKVRKLFQNGLYDIAFLWRAMKIKVINAEEDTMLLHHALQPESLKGLGFLGSLYTDHGSWKQLRQVNTIKRDD